MGERACLGDQHISVDARSRLTHINAPSFAAAAMYGGAVRGRPQILRRRTVLRTESNDGR
jgi:hypothetical protein